MIHHLKSCNESNWIWIYHLLLENQTNCSSVDACGAKNEKRVEIELEVLIKLGNETKERIGTRTQQLKKDKRN